MIDGDRHRQKSLQLDGQMVVFSGETFLKRGLVGTLRRTSRRYSTTTLVVYYIILCGPSRRKSEASLWRGGGGGGGGVKEPWSCLPIYI